MGEQEAVYTMAVTARLTGLHPQTLRKYERAGLIKPARQAGKQRLYSEDDLQRIRRIQYLVDELGLNIAGLELALAVTDRLDELHADASRAELRSAISDVGRMSRKR